MSLASKDRTTSLHVTKRLTTSMPWKSEWKPKIRTHQTLREHLLQHHFWHPLKTHVAPLTSTQVIPSSQPIKKIYIYTKNNGCSKAFLNKKALQRELNLTKFCWIGKRRTEKKKSIFHLRFQQYYVANSILQICFLVRKSHWSYLATCTGRIQCFPKKTGVADADTGPEMVYSQAGYSF